MPLPFATTDETEVEDCSGSQCSIRSLLSGDLQERAEATPHLMAYLHRVPIGDVGVPDYYEKASRKLGDLKEPNLIYSVDESLLVHILGNPEDARDHYIAIEPNMLEDMQPLIAAMEVRLLDYVEELSEAEDDEQKTEILIRAVDECCVVTNGNGSKAERKTKRGGGLFGIFSNGSDNHGPIAVTSAELAALQYTLVRDKLGMGALEPILKDPNIEDISCSGVGPLFIEHKIFKGLTSSIAFANTEELDEFVLRMAERIGTSNVPRADRRRHLAGRVSYQHRIRLRCLENREQLHDPKVRLDTDQHS